MSGLPVVACISPLAVAARIVSWPLALLYVAVGLVWRTIAAPFLPGASRAAGFRPARDVRVPGRRVPDGGRTRWPTSAVLSVRGQSALVQAARLKPVAMLSWMVFAVYVYVALAAQVGWIASGFRDAAREHSYAAPGEFGFVLGTDASGAILALAVRGDDRSGSAPSPRRSCLIGSLLHWRATSAASSTGSWSGSTTLESIPRALLPPGVRLRPRSNPAIQEAYDACS